jgi:hypothetical protein
MIIIGAAKRLQNRNKVQNGICANNFTISVLLMAEPKFDFFFKIKSAEAKSLEINYISIFQVFLI